MGYMSIGELGHIAEPRRRDWVARYPSSLRNRIERVQEVARRSGEPIEARHEQGIAFGK